MNKRKAFNFYRSFYDIYKELNEKQAKEFMDNLLAVEFLEKSIDEVVFKDKICSIVWNSIKHSIESQIKGYSHKMGISLEDNNATEPPCLPPTEPPCLQEEGKGKGKEKGEGRSNAPFHFASLSDLIKELKTTKDLKDHKPIKATKELDDYLNSFEYQTVEDKEIVDYVLDIGYCFIKYRDYMYKETKENKYKIKTFASVKQFINAVSNNYSHIDLETLFDKLESRGWATIEKGYKI